MTDETTNTVGVTPASPVLPGMYPPNPMPAQWQSLTLTDSVGAIFLGIFSCVVLIGWMRAEARYRRLAAQGKD